MKEERVNVRIPGILWKRLKAWKKKQGFKTASEAIRAAIRQVTKPIEETQGNSLN